MRTSHARSVSPPASSRPSTSPAAPRSATAPKSARTRAPESAACPMRRCWPGWLGEHVASVERRHDRVREELLARCRAELIEPPTPDRVREIVRSGLYRAEQALLAVILERLDSVTVARLETLIAVNDEEEREEDVLSLIKAAPGNVSLETMLTETSKLEAIRAVGLPADLFAGIAPNVMVVWRARAAVESPVHLREHPQPTRLALPCALLALREREVTDALAQLLIATVHRINAHAE
jgi:hypothetical protein